ncbi:FAN1 [Branchiostoma lanceolatum]|uniref:Fanconi-associated nuclease n=1 Tax=Branchiostoma lanceolatum TaxID=7740 RepID=A0A8J9ZGW0_BRALA|nr:FAN1 [Branchiostoma lanceolatum]
MSEDGQAPRKRLSLKSRRANKKAKLEDTDKNTSSKPSSSTSRSNGNSIMSAFARQKTPNFASCPVCDKSLPISWMNSHLDNGCLQGVDPEYNCRETALQSNAASKCPDPAFKNDMKCVDAALEDKKEFKDSFECDMQEGSLASSSKHSEESTSKSTRDRSHQPMGSTSPYFKKNNPPPRPSIDEEKLASMSKKISKLSRKFKADRPAQSRRRNKVTKPVVKEEMPNVDQHQEIQDLDTNSVKKESVKPNAKIKHHKVVPLPNMGAKFLYLDVKELLPNFDDDIAQELALFQLSQTSNTDSTDTTAATPSDDNSIKEDVLPDVIPELSREDSGTSHVDEDMSSMDSSSFDGYKSQPSVTEEDSSSQSRGFLEDSADSSKGESVDDSSKDGKPRVPYYLQNFNTVLTSVFENEDDRSLFNEEDMKYIETFNRMDEAAQKLYVRLFQRKLAWHRQGKLQYPEIAEDLGPVCQVLVREGYLQNERDLTDVTDVLQHLPAPDLKTLAKSLHIPTTSLPRAQLVQSILNHGKVQRTIFGDGSAMILRRARKLLGGCVRLTTAPRAVFTRVLLLFNLSSAAEEEDKGSGGQQQLQTILMVKMGRVTYPDFTINRPTKIFNCREDLLRYEQAMQFENDITVAMETNKFQLAHQLYLSATEVFSTFQQDPEIARYDAGLPSFLRCFTASWVYTGILSRGVEVYEKLRQYREAVDLLNSLLSDSLYCADSHGRWYDRLALNLESHLKRPEEALQAILRGLADPEVRSGHRLALMIRAHRLCDSNNNPKLRTRKAELPPIPLRDLPKVTITGRVFPVNQPGYKNVFITTDSYTEDSQDVTICSVEELSLAHYRGQGYEEGIHGEGGTYWTLCLLLLWDVVFMEGVADVFRSPYQSCPLDRYSDNFYPSRKAAIDGRLEDIRQADIQTLQSWVSDSWSRHDGQACAGLNWDRFTSVEHAQGLVACMGGQFLAAVFARLLRDARHCRSGLPDLTVWSNVSRKFKVVEVKGPGDRLSQKQMLWLDYFLSLGAQAEVCHVVATGAKKLKKSSI